LPFIQCHHTRGFASAGGVRNCASRRAGIDEALVAVGEAALSAFGAGRRGVGVRAAGARGVARCAAPVSQRTT